MHELAFIKLMFCKSAELSFLFKYFTWSCFLMHQTGKFVFFALRIVANILHHNDSSDTLINKYNHFIISVLLNSNPY